MQLTTPGSLLSGQIITGTRITSLTPTMSHHPGAAVISIHCGFLRLRNKPDKYLAGVGVGLVKFCCKYRELDILQIFWDKI